MNSDNPEIKKPVLLYCYQSNSSFVSHDIASLKIDYTVKTFHFQPRYKYLLPVSFLRQKVFLLGNIFSAEILMCQFAGYHSIIPVLFGKLFHKPCVVVVGGTDCTSMPSINYGNLRKPIIRWFTLKSLKYSTHIVSPSISLIECDYSYSSRDFPRQGFRYFDESIKTPFTVIFNGVDTSHFKPDINSTRKRNSFLTLCGNLDERNFSLKGIDMFIAVAEHLPDCEFTIIGRKAHGFNILLPANVTLIDYIQHKLLPSKMSEFGFYCQLSMSEGFGLALAEAMACGCVPIVSRVGIMDFIVGNSGFVLEKRDKQMLKSLIRKAIESDIVTLSLKARTRVVDNFDIKIRQHELLQLIKSLR